MLKWTRFGKSSVMNMVGNTRENRSEVARMCLKKSIMVLSHEEIDEIKVEENRWRRNGPKKK